ncbi:uncharacterized protein DMAD_05755 [Drosophila madeirensis]|uniref:Uncharacterized protein n=1 Tax=Drosophila madeirensis TaxID=30013 RepID=A0AAU9FNV8_DROMD
MRSCALFLLVLLAVFGSLSALLLGKPSRRCRDVIKSYGPQCGTRIKSLFCRKFFEDAKPSDCYQEFLKTFEK